MTDFLLEVRSEEIPARMQARARADLERLFVAALDGHGIAAKDIVTYATPRRLALIARGLPDQTEPVREEIKGPRSNAPEQALDGFLRKTGLTRDQLVERDGVLFAVIDRAGQPLGPVLAGVVEGIVTGFPWPKSMRWGADSLSPESLRWVRPLQGIVALFGDALIADRIAGVPVSATTYGHRFHHPVAITIGGASDYVEKLRAAHVIVDQDERRDIIRNAATIAAETAGFVLVADESLVTENAGLTEWPVPLLGRFDPAFLDVPPEVIRLTMATNQKYFACADRDGAIAPAFVCVANIVAQDGGAAIIAGNQKVLAARLADARFFWEQDLKVPLDDQAAKLTQIVFHEKLGTVADKVERVAYLARRLVEQGIVIEKPLPFRGGVGEGTVPAIQALGETDTPHPNPSPEGEGLQEFAALAERAAKLCKADLVTGMVGEFPELQGVMGGYYAAAQGQHPAVAAAIRDHYKPVGQGDDVPTDPVTVAVSLADKLDTLYGFFLIDELPTGSRDPFALRRAGLSVISLIITNALYVWINFSDELAYYYEQKLSHERDTELKKIQDLMELQLKQIPEGPEAHFLRADTERRTWGLQDRCKNIYQEKIDYYSKYYNIGKKVFDFLIDRLKVQQREAGVRHDLIDAVFALGGEDDLVRLLARVKALQSFITTPDGANLLAGYKRAANILKKEGVVAADRTPANAGVQESSAAGLDPGLRRGTKTDLSYTPESAEAALIGALDTAEPAAAAAIAAEDFEAAMAALASLRAPIDAFFETVTVNDPDPAKRTARLALLARVRDACHAVADFSKIEG